MSALDKLFDIAPQLTDGMKRGAGHVMVRCPYHGGGHERTPSMAISTLKPVWFCHACKASGHLSQILRSFGVPRAMIDVLLPRDDKGQYERGSSSLAAKILRGKNPFRGKYILDEAVLDYYRLAPTTLLRAGFAKETLRHFEVGYDEQNVRITFPLRTVLGDLVGISGRSLYDEIEPRYKLYDAELIKRKDFHIPKDYSMEEVKRALLWHGHIVRPLFFIPNNGKQEIIITEGFKACMWTWQNGFEDTIAIMGSYLTQQQAELLSRATRRITLFLDNNEAGVQGTCFAGFALLQKGVEVRVARYPDQRQQPDSLSTEELHQTLTQTWSFREWLAAHLTHELRQKILHKKAKDAYFEKRAKKKENH